MAFSVDRKLRLSVAGGLAALLVGGALVGTALARPGGPGAKPEQRAAATERREAFVDRLAANLGVSEQKLREAMVKTRQEQVDEAVRAGRLTPEQGERIKQRVQQNGGFGFGPRERGAHQRGLRGPRAALLDTVSQALGLSQQELRTRLRSGQSIAEIARDGGKDPDRVKHQIVSALESKIDEAVKDGQIPAARGEEIKRRVEQHVDRLMNRKPGEQRGPGRDPEGRPRGPRGGA